MPVTASGGYLDAAVAKQAPGDMYQNFRQAQIHSAECDKALAEKMRLVAAAFRRYRNRYGHFPEEGQDSLYFQKSLSRAAGRNAYGGFERYLVGPDSTPASSRTTKETNGFESSPNSAPARVDPSSSSTSGISNSRPFAAPPPQAAAEQLSSAYTPSELTVGSPTVSVDQTNALTPVKIKVDLALSSILLSSFQRATPASWTAEPGTITVFHNTEDFYLVWGAGIDGKPIRIEGSDKPLVITPAGH